MLRLLPVLVLFLAVPALGQVSDDLASTYLDKTGLPSEIEGVGGQILQQVSGQAAQMPEAAREPFRVIYSEEMDADALRDRLISYVVSEGDAERLRDALTWMEQPLVRRMHAVEDSSADDPNAPVAVQMYVMTGSFATPVTPEREEQMDRYLAATDATDKGVGLYLDLIVATSESMRALTPDDMERLPADTLRARMRPQLEEMMGGMIRGSTLYAFRDTPDAEFDAYIAQLDTPAAQYASDLGTAAMTAALVGAITDAGRRFIAVLTELDAAGEISLEEMRNQGSEGRGGEGATN